MGMFSKEPIARGATITRRTLLTAGLGAGVVSVLAACSSPAPPAPAAATPATAAKPAATTPPAAAAAQPAATAASKPAAPAAAKTDLGQLVGKLEGATIVTDPALVPKTFK